MTEAAMTPRDVHEILTKDFTDRYIRRQGLGAVAYSAPYDSSDPICDYEKTWWAANPNRLSIPVGRTILKTIHKMNGQDMDDFAGAFSERAGEITQSLAEFPLMYVNGHNPDLQAALSLFSANVGVAQASGAGNFQREFEDMTRISHGVATRGIVPIVIGRPRLPWPKIPFIRLEQLVVNPHHSFPINKQMIESGITPDFRKAYNARLRQESIDVARGGVTNHPRRYHTQWSMAPNGTPDFEGEGEHEGKTITKKVEPATIRLILEMGCGLLNVRTSFGRGKRPTVVELADVILPNEVTPSTIPTMMADLADFRRQNGEPDVYYEEELAA